MVPATAHIAQKTSLVKEFATRALGRRDHFDMDAPAPPYVIFHQTSPVLLQTVAASVGISADHHLFNSDRYGNCAGAGCVSVLSENWCVLRSRAARLILVTIGAGLSSGRAEFQFGSG
jgi:3-oxoacyl-[acyl-carrier-protein] synthase III